MWLQNVKFANFTLVFQWSERNFFLYSKNVPVSNQLIFTCFCLHQSSFHHFVFSVHICVTAGCVLGHPASSSSQISVSLFPLYIPKSNSLAIWRIPKSLIRIYSSHSFNVFPNHFWLSLFWQNKISESIVPVLTRKVLFASPRTGKNVFFSFSFLLLYPTENCC